MVLDAFDAVLPQSLALSLRADVLHTCTAQANLNPSEKPLHLEGQDREWSAFIYVICALLTSSSDQTRSAGPSVPVSKSRWDSLLASDFHAAHSRKRQLKGLSLSSETSQHSSEQLQGAIKALGASQFQTEPMLCIAHISDIFDTLHLVYEQSKLSVLSVLYLRPLAMLLFGLAQRWNACDFMDYYQRDISGLIPAVLVSTAI
jgi:hypothetical protein